jgi:hypothetical protein
VNYDAADAMGWHHSAWDQKQILAVSPVQIHASAQWCRYNAAGERILPNNVSYVITQVDGRWGIQARFGVDSALPDDPNTAVGRAKAAWRRLREAMARSDAEELEQVVRLPFNLIGVGRITVATTANEVVDHLGGVGTATGEAVDLQVGQFGVNLGAELREENGDTCHALLLVVLSDQGARVSAISLLRGAHVVRG